MFFSNTLKISKTQKEKLKGILSLSILNGANYIFPIAIIPIVASKIGPDGYGLTSFAHYFVLYFTLLINYGFDYSATKELAETPDDKEKAVLFNKFLSSKFYLFLAATFFFVVVVILNQKINLEKSLFFVTYLINIGFLLTPSWFFQDKGKLFIPAIVNFFAKALSIPFLFWLIKEKSDYLLLNLILSLAQIISGLAIFLYAVNKYRIKLNILGIRDCITTYKDGFYLFANSVVIHLYTSTNIVLLGFFATSAYETGIYSSSVRVISGLLTVVLFPATQFLFPYATREFSKDKKQGVEYIFKIGRMLLVISICSFSILLFASFYVINILFGEKYLEAVRFVKVMSPVTFFIATSSLFGMVGLVNLGKEKRMFQITLVGAIVSVLLNSILIPKISIMGASITWIVTEFLIAAACVFFFINENRKING